MEYFNLNRSQKRIYVEEKMNPGTSLWNVPYAVKMNKSIDKEKMMKAIQYVFSSNGVFQINIMEKENQVFQFVNREKKCHVEYMDLGKEGGLKKWKIIASREAETPIDIKGKRLYKVLFAKIDEKCYGLLIVAHHIIMDGTSADMVIRSIIDNYERLIKGVAFNNGLKDNFFECLEYEDNYFKSSKFQEDKKYWEEKTADMPEPAELMFRDKKDGVETDREDIRFSKELSDKIYEFCGEKHISPYRFFITCLSVLSCRVKGLHRMVFGTVAANRNEFFLNSAGNYISPEPLIIKMNEEVGFLQACREVGESVKEAVAHSRYPYENIIDYLHARFNEVPHLLDTMVVGLMQPKLPAEYEMDYFAYRTSTNNITFYFSYSKERDEKDPIRLLIDYKTKNMKREEVNRMWKQVARIMTEVLNQPDMAVKEISILDKEEKNKILSGFNGIPVYYPSMSSLNQAIEEQSAYNDGRLAVVMGEKEYSYSQINSMSNQLARKMIGKGFNKGDIAGIYLDQSPEMIIALLAALKAGGAYLPIDIKYPKDRVEFMARDANAKFIITGTAFLRKLPKSAEAINLDDKGLFSGDDRDLSLSVAKKDPACVIYTSGSTGLPKGVVLEHGGMINFSYWFARHCEMNNQDRVSKHASFSFDASILEIFPTLFSGACLHIIPENIRLSLNDINEYFEKNGITIAFFTTQFAEQFMDLVDNHSLRFLATGGEKLRNFKKRRYQLVNLYGPTEATVCVTAYNVHGRNGDIPIGKPIGNCLIYILDDKDRLVPMGVPGELCVGGIPLAKGYLNREDLNREKFMENPFVKGERIYKTGDLARWTLDGNIEHLGRIDRQVKIRGYRIEPEEVEREMMKSDDIKEAAVHPFTDGSGRLVLCGYYTSEKKLEEKDVKEKLRNKLPSYMIPSYFVFLEKLPLTASGKIDRKRLPKPVEKYNKENKITAPENALQKKLIDIWKEVLKVDEIGIDHRFFNLGGHSLNAISILVKVEKELGKRVSLKDFLNNPTIRQLGELVNVMETREEEIEKAPELETYPATPNQSQLFMLEEMGNIGTVYNVTIKLELGDGVDIKRLGDAIDQLIEKRSIFRTSFVMIDGFLKQKIEKKARLKRVLIESSEEDMENAISDFVKPFNLSKAPLLRTLLIKGKDGKYVLLIDTHHIVFDGISYNLLISDLKELYFNHDVDGDGLEFKDYSFWYKKETEKGKFETQGDYWREKLKSLPVLDPPTDYRRSPEADFKGGRVSRVLDDEMVAELKRICLKNSVTLHSLFLAAVHVLLAKYTNQEDIVVGTPMAGRFRKDFFEIMGMFVNTLPVRCFPERGKSFRSFLKEVGREMLEVTENQEYPVDLIYKSAESRREAGRNPLFDVIFVMENIEYPAFSEGDLFKTAELIYDQTAKFDLNFTAEEIEDRLYFHIEYRNSLFERDTIERMFGHFIKLLGHILEEPDAEISQLNMLNQREEIELLYQYNQTAAEWPKDKTLPALFEEQAERFPERTAVEFGKEKLSYRDLDRKANQLANRLRKNGVGPDKIVGIFLDRGLEMIIVALGVLKAGGAYLPVIPDYPPERIDYIFKDSGAEIVLTSSTLSKELNFKGKIYHVDEPDFFQGSDKGPELVNKKDDMAYVIYTSGSTGKPKGVMVEHGNVVRLLKNDRFYFDFSEEDVWTLFHSFSFDFSVWEMYGALLFGGKLVIVPKDAALNPESFRKLLVEKQVTILNQTPGAFYNLADAEMKTSERELCLRMVIFGGEALKPVLLKPFHEKYPDVQLINMYGITETTVHVTYKELTDEEINNNISNIGLPIPTLSTYVFDEGGRLVPYGVAGELCVGGDGVTRGYLNKEELTQKRFIENPYVPGERIYRSGDLVKRLKTGEMIYLGRLDFQVQLHGFRVELGEIENEILKYAGIEKSVVLAKEDKEHIQYLLAYYISPKEISVNEFRERLGKTLPDYMIPSYFIKLEEMPLTSNGKIDRRALPEPGLEVRTGTDYQGAENRKQERMIKVWQDILGVKKIGIHDNFFSLGGHSLKAVALVSKLRENFELSVNDIFNYPTISELSENVAELEGGLIGKLIRLRDSLKDGGQPETKEIKEGYEKYLLKGREIEKAFDNKGKDYRQVLLTGATGFLGSYLLRGLLAKGFSVAVIVRGENENESEKRLKIIYEGYFGEEAGKKLSLVRVYAGDLEKDYLGLERKDYLALAEQTDCVVHSAANVRHFGNYEDFYSANVLATMNVLKFCQEGSRKDFNHVSTCSVAHGSVAGMDEVLFTEFDCDLGQKSDNVYVKSKFAAEKEILKYYSKGGAGKIFRLGNIAFDSETGSFQKNIKDNAFYQQVKSYLNLGYVPHETDERDISFVDQCADAILTLFNKPALKNMNFHIENPYKVKLSKILNDRKLGLLVDKVSAAEFIDYLIVNYNRPYFKGFIDNIMLHMGWLEDEDHLTEFYFRSDLTNRLLKTMGFRWKNADPGLFGNIIDIAYEERAERISKADVFEGLPQEELLSIVKRAKLEYYDDGDDLYWEGEENPNLYLILRGNTAINKKSSHGWSGTISIAGKDELIGEENIVSSGGAPVTVEAVLGDVVVLRFPSEDWKGYLRRYPQLSERMIIRLNRKIDRLRSMIISLG